jgi:rod shape-determining protein MreD
MNRDMRATVATLVTMAACILLQSTLLHAIDLGGVHPDLALLVLIFASMRRGAMVGQVAGFASGFLEDLMNVSPLGFHSLLRTVMGFLYGLLSGNVFIDPFVMPIVLAVVATILKGFLSGLVSAMFGLDASGFITFTGRLWIECGYNGLVAPFLFALLNLFKVFKQADKDGG